MIRHSSKFLQSVYAGVLWAGLSGVLFFGFASDSLAGPYLSIDPPQAKHGDTITFTIKGPPSGGTFLCVVPPGYQCDPAKFLVLPVGGVQQVTYRVPADLAVGTVTYTLHLYSDRDLNTEYLTYRDTAQLEVLPAANNNTPPATVTTIPSDLECPLGLPKDGPTGLCLPTNPLTPASSSLVASSSVGQLIQRFLDILLTLAGVVAILFIVIGGYQYITSRGAEDQAKAGRKTMTYAIIGLLAVLLAYTGVNLVVRLITTGTLFG